MSILSGFLSSVASLASRAMNQNYNDSVRREQNIFNKYEAQRAREWNQQMDSTKYQRTVNDMQQAGVNPALAMQGGVSTQAASNVSASAAPNVPSNVDMTSAVQAAIQARSLEIQERLAASQERKNNADAEREEINNRYLAGFNELRNQGMDLQNKLTSEQRKEIVSRVRNLDETFKLIGQQVKTEVERTALTEAEAALRRSMKDKTDQEIVNMVSLLPFQKSLMAAQTDSARADAAYKFAQAAIQNGLVDAGYVQSVAQKAAADAGISDADKFAREYANAVKTGDTAKIAQLLGTGNDTQSEAVTKSVVSGLNVLSGVVGNFFGKISL